MPCVNDETMSSVEGVRIIWQRSLGAADLPASLHWVRTCKTVWGSDGTVWKWLMCQSACGNMHNVREKKGSSIKVNSKAKKVYKNTSTLPHIRLAHWANRSSDRSVYLTYKHISDLHQPPRKHRVRSKPERLILCAMTVHRMRQYTQPMTGLYR